MTDFLAKIAIETTGITLISDHRFAWSPAKDAIYYESSELGSNQGKLTLLHEISHAQLKHHRYKSDLELLQLEVQAWKQAKMLASKYGVVVDEDYIHECIESYREWLYRRSMCVECSTNSLQDVKGVYHCHICGTSWSVPGSQLCKIARRKIKK